MDTYLAPKCSEAVHHWIESLKNSQANSTKVRLEPRRSATARVAAPAKEEKLILPALQ